MPAFRITTNTTSTIQPLEILGMERQLFLCHAMLCDERNSRADVTSRSRVRVTHMCPPILVGDWQCHVAGRIELTDNEKCKIDRFVSQFRKEMEANIRRSQIFPSSSQYIIYPEAVPPTSNRPNWSFSCVGYVLAAYQTARLVLLHSDRPLRTLDELKTLYPQFAGVLNDPVERAKYIPGGGDKWPVALVGYLFNSLARPDVEVRSTPFRPDLGDEYFPSQRTNVSEVG